MVITHQYSNEQISNHLDRELENREFGMLFSVPQIFRAFFMKE